MTTEVTFVPATPQHCEQLAPVMREADVNELIASEGMLPLPALLAALSISDFAQTVLFNGRVACIWGTCPAQDFIGVGSIWLLTSTEVDKHPVSFCRHVRPALVEALGRYPVLFNYVDARYAKALRFAAALGFQVLPPVAHGAAQLPFCPILLRKESVVCVHPQ